MFGDIEAFMICDKDTGRLSVVDVPPTDALIVAQGSAAVLCGALVLGTCNGHGDTYVPGTLDDQYGGDFERHVYEFSKIVEERLGKQITL